MIPSANMPMTRLEETLHKCMVQRPDIWEHIPSAVMGSCWRMSVSMDAHLSICTMSITYDGLGQLVRVNDPHENATWVYEYDRGGNITNKIKYAYTTDALSSALQTIEYKYDDDWKDKLKEYNGSNLEYDAIGNLTYDGTWNYIWEKGRQLKQMSKSGTTIQFKYDHNGIRTQKIVTVNGTTTTTNYVYNGNKLVHLTQGNNWMHFFYDGQGQPAMVNFNGTMYTFIRNLQGDIIGILDSSGIILIEYKYDAWGCPTYSNSIVDSNSTLTARYALILTLNPFRYRGYVYDVETSLCYLQNRYFSINVGRFVNADSLTQLKNSNNVFAYVNNMPICSIDKSGNLPSNIFKRAMWIDINISEDMVFDIFNEAGVEIPYWYTDYFAYTSGGRDIGERDNEILIILQGYERISDYYAINHRHYNYFELKAHYPKEGKLYNISTAVGDFIDTVALTLYNHPYSALVGDFIDKLGIATQALSLYLENKGYMRKTAPEYRYTQTRSTVIGDQYFKYSGNSCKPILSLPYDMKAHICH